MYVNANANIHPQNKLSINFILIIFDHMAKLPYTPTLPELQKYMAINCEERGWDKTDVLETFLLFSEEIGELAKAIRNRRGLYTEKGKVIKDNELESEFADVLGYLLELANKFNVDLESAFREKEKMNAEREWE